MSSLFRTRSTSVLCWTPTRRWWRPFNCTTRSVVFLRIVYKANGQLSKPAVLDSDSEDETPSSNNPREMENINKRLAAQKLEADRTGELEKLQDRQKRESARRAAQRRAPPQPRASAHPDLDDLDFGAINRESANKLPPPIQPNNDQESYSGTLSDYSDYDYNSSDEEWRTKIRSRRQSRAGPSGGAGKQDRGYATLEDDGHGKRGLLDPNDPFGDPFADDADTPHHEKQRMQCESSGDVSGVVLIYRGGDLMSWMKNLAVQYRYLGKIQATCMVFIECK